MFCPNCGNQCPDTHNVCVRCGTKLRETPVAPNMYPNQYQNQNQYANPTPNQYQNQYPNPNQYQNQYPNPNQYQNQNQYANPNPYGNQYPNPNPNQYNPQPGGYPAPAAPMDMKKIFGIGMLVFAGLAFLSFILMLVDIGRVSDGTYTITYNVWYGRTVEEHSGALDVIANILFAIILLAATGVSLLYGLREVANMPLYDQYLGKISFISKRPLLVTGTAAAGGAFLQFLLYVISPASFGIHAMSWIMMVLGAGLVCVDLFVLNFKK